MKPFSPVRVMRLSTVRQCLFCSVTRTQPDTMSVSHLTNLPTNSITCSSSLYLSSSQWKRCKDEGGEPPSSLQHFEEKESHHGTLDASGSLTKPTYCRNDALLMTAADHKHQHSFRSSIITNDLFHIGFAKQLRIRGCKEVPTA